MTFRFNEINLGATTLFLLNYELFDVNLFSHYLSTDEKPRMDSFRHINRKREFLATRILSRRIFGKTQICYNKHGAPFIDSKHHISISHSKNIVGIAVNSAFIIGLDLEPHRENILSLTQKFLSPEEKLIFKTESTLEMTKVWSAKEVLYKLAGRKQIIFSDQLLLNKDDLGSWLGTIINQDHHLCVKLNIFELNDTIVSINTTPLVKIPINS